MAIIFLLFNLLAGISHFSDILYVNDIAIIDMRHVFRLILAAKQDSDL